MCGFVAMIGLDGKRIDKEVVERMLRSIEHRGPDAKNTLLEETVGFGFQRLSILDLTTASDQPMSSQDGQVVIVFNGEIFNYVELREELLALGHTFRSSGDTEVLLHAYLEWDTDCLKRLNGMWAFLVYDKRKKKIFGSRDRFGIKPLYKYVKNDCIYFASEIKSILKSGHHPANENWQVISKYLLQQRLDDEDITFWQRVDRVPAGGAFEIMLDGKTRQWNYWQIQHFVENISNPLQKFKETFQDAVRIRLRSDVPVGVCLSGGMDSTSIICAMDKLNRSSTWGDSNAIQAFCYMSNDHDETKYIQETLQLVNAKLNSLQKSPVELWNDLSKVLWYHDEPVHSLTAVVGFDLFEIAAKGGVKVVLNGQGADEYLAGYPNYFMNYWLSLLRDRKIGDTFNEIKLFCQGHDGSTSMKFLNALSLHLKSKINRYLTYRKIKQFKDRLKFKRIRWYKPELIDHLRIDIPDYMDPTLDSILKYSVEVNPLPLYLRIEDRNSMAHSIEARLPFMDYRLISLLFNLPANLKMNGHWNKFILREAMQGEIPEIVRKRIDKMGFPTSTSKWFASSLFNIVREIVHSRNFAERGIYNADIIADDLEKHRRGYIDISAELFSVLQLEIWFNNFNRYSLSDAAV
jgi:asparagine synthase (glutamine-hydrolysing)